MNTLVTEKVVNSLFSDKQFYKEFKAMLNTLIEQELAKEVFDMDCDLIDDCTNMLIELEQEENENGFAVIIPPISAKRIINACTKHDFKSLSRGMRASLVACVILLSTVTCNAAVYKITGHNVAQEIAESINEKFTDWGLFSYADEDELYVNEVPTGSENFDAGFEDDETTTTTVPTTKPKPPVTSSENHDAGFEDNDDETTTNKPPVTGSENTDVGFEDDTPTIVRPKDKKYNITFDSDGGSEIAPRAVTYKKPIGELPTPIKEGYYFMGWYNTDISFEYNEIKIGLSSIVTKEALPITADTVYNIDRDAVLTAKWNKICTVEFYMKRNGGTCDVQYMTVNEQGKLPYLPIPVKDGYVFDYWYYYTEKSWPNPATATVDENTVFTEDKLLHPHWTRDVRNFKLSFDANGGECAAASKSVVYNEPFGELPTPTRDGYIFMGWYKGKNVTSGQVNESTVLSDRKSITLYALWSTKSCTVHFDTNGSEQQFDDLTIYANHQVGTLPEPRIDGYTFDGWYLGDELINSKSVIKGLEEFDDELTFVAKYSPAEVEITFDTNGGDLRSSNYKYYYLGSYTNLPEASTAGYRFIGWFTEPDGGEQISTDDIINKYEPFTLYAHWEELENTVSAVIHSNRSIEEIYTINYTVGDTVGELEIPAPTTDSERDYTKFIGWFDDRYYGNEINADTVITEDMNIYAHWALDGMIAKMVSVNITNLKPIYELNEELDVNTLSAEIVVKNSVLQNSTTDLSDILDEDGRENHFFGADTSTVGSHTVEFRFACPELNIIGLGVIYFETSADYTVVDCDHTNTHIEKYKQPTCTSKGYSGNTVCDDCGYTLTYGTSLDALGHDENTQTYIRDEKAATCHNNGYTGDVCCKSCLSVLQKGEVIPYLNHPETYISRAKEPTCADKGYTGDVVCTICKEILVKGNDIPKLEHSEIKVFDIEPTCSYEGYKGVKECTVCGYIVDIDEVIPKLPHNTVIVNAKEATCGECGYTGDEICTECDYFKEGRYTNNLPHKNIVPVPDIPATCTEDGHTGATICTDCNTIIKKGTVVKATGHNEQYVNEKASLGKAGYIGRKCTLCGELYSGREVPAIASIGLEKTKYAYTGTQITPNIVVTDTEGNKITDYFVTYPSARTEEGTYRIKLVLKGDYTGTHYINFEITAPSFGVYKSERAGSYFTIYWTKPETACNGYEIMLMNDEGVVHRNFTINGPNMTSYDFPKKYHTKDTYVIMRYFTKKTVDGVETKVYSEWSDKFYVNQ